MAVRQTAQCATSTILANAGKRPARTSRAAMNTTYFRLTACSIAASLVLVGCADMSPRQKGTAQGAGIGAAAGAVLGGITGAQRRHRRGGRRRARRGRRQRLVQAPGRPPHRDGKGDPGHRRRGQPHRRQPAEAERAERHLVRRPTARRSSPSCAPCWTRSRTACAATRTRASASSATPTTPARRRSTTRCRSTARKACATTWSSRGVAPSQIETSGLGDRNPVADNNTDAGRAQNRRVEIFLRETA